MFDYEFGGFLCLRVFGLFIFKHNDMMLQLRDDGVFIFYVFLSMALAVLTFGF